LEPPLPAATVHVETSPGHDRAVVNVPHGPPIVPPPEQRSQTSHEKQASNQRDRDKKQHVTPPFVYVFTVAFFHHKAMIPGSY
jgi:hypothetical protein